MKRKILFLIPTLQEGGAEKALVNIVNSVDHSEFDITVQALVAGGRFADALSSDVHYRSVISTRSPLLYRFFTLLIFHVLPARIVHSIFIKGRYDVEIAFLEGPPTRIINSSGNPNSFKIAWVHTDPRALAAVRMPLRRRLMADRSYRRFDAVYCVSETVKQGFLELVNTKATVGVQYNVVDGDAIRRAAEEGTAHRAIDVPLLVSVGRLTEVKGYDRLINACHSLKMDGLEFRLVILGEGRDRAHLEKQIDELGLSSMVTLCGFLDNPYPLVSEADLFVCSSRVEGLSTAVTEALILGTPVLTTSCAGMDELLGDGEFGAIVSNDTLSLTAGLRRLLTDQTALKHYQQQSTARGAFFDKPQRVVEFEQLLRLTK